MPTRYIDKVVDLFKTLRTAGAERDELIPRPALIRRIRIVVGGSDLTVDRYIKYLKDMDFIDVSAEDKTKFRINWEEIEKVMLEL